MKKNQIQTKESTEQAIERYQESIRYLEGLSNLPLKGDYMIRREHLGIYLKKMRHFLGLIGNPDKGIKYIHITGTAGKGSVTNMIHEMLHADGRKVGCFTSPFVTTTIEKIKVGGLYISPGEFADIVDYLKPYIDQEYLTGPYGRPSYFEICMAIGFEYFKRQKCEWAVLEVGCGGRFDATNIIDAPVVSAITNIDYDHTHLLGRTLDKIGYDKAGIIKSGSVFYTTERRTALLSMFRSICREKNVVCNEVLCPGGYVEKNQALCAAIAKHVGVSNTSIKAGISKAKLACRFEKVQSDPIVILDGAHNRSKIRSTVDNLSKLTYRKLHVVIGIGESKDSAAILAQIIPLADSVAYTRYQIKDRKCAHPKELLSKSKKYIRKGAITQIFLDPMRALDHTLHHANKKDVVLVVGSFFLAGELRKHWYSEKSILEHRVGFGSVRE